MASNRATHHTYQQLISMVRKKTHSQLISLLWKAFKYQPISLLFLISLFNLKKVRVIFQNMVEETKSFISRIRIIRTMEKKLDVDWKNHRWNQIFSMPKKKSFKTYARLITSFSLGFIKRGACMAALPSAILPLKRWIKNNSVTAW